MEYNLNFNKDNYEIETLTIDNKTIIYRSYENIVYVKNPVDINYQIMNIYVPKEYYEGKSIGKYNIETAPIFFPNTVGGYMPGKPEKPGKNKFTGDLNAIFVALLKGYVVASPGARGRVTQDENGLYTGKAPACIVDLKAAVRYLRHNSKIIPGDTEKIISNGTSAGGALSSLLGATGNSVDYKPYLNEIGAADERDDVFAASCYCPITNLDNADMAYEWMFNGINDYKKLKFTQMADFRVERTWIEGTMNEEQIKASNDLKALFPSYLNSIEIKKSDGTELKLDANGEGTFKEYVKSFVIESSQKALNSGTDLSKLTWITIKEGTIIDIDFNEYVKFATRMKPTCAFDDLCLYSPENELFGTETIKAKHFSKFSYENSMVDGSIANLAIIKMMNPMNYIGSDGSTTANYWRIRHGAIDRDTSLAIPVILATKLKNSKLNVDFALPWGISHAGDYDLDELFDWIENICASN